MRLLPVVLVVLAACGSAVGGGGGTPAPPPPPTAALTAWKDFPADANPRPIVIFDRTIEHIGEAGFSQEPDRKLDWGCNKFVLAPMASLPAATPASATAGNRSVPALSAVESYSALLAARARLAAPDSHCAAARPFAIKDVRWQAAGFPTDRGTVQMSAWLFDIGEIDAYIGFAAVDPSVFWQHGAVPEGGGGGVSSDGMTLTLATFGGPNTPGPCGEDFAASVAESDTAVAFAIASQFHTPPAGEGCDLAGYGRTVTVRLSRPLGGRVLVDAKGKAGMVCTEGADCQ